MPDLLLQETNPYGTRRASLLRGWGDAYLYLEDLVADAPSTRAAVWVANHAPTPRPHEDVEPGAPPRMGAGGTLHPDGCPHPTALRLVWFEEGDGVALLDDDGVLAAIPGWGGEGEFAGYARHARGRTALAWELNGETLGLLEAKVAQSEAHWAWRSGAWAEIRDRGFAHLEARLGPAEEVWPLDGGRFPEVVASRHRVGTRDLWVTATTGLSAQRMAGVEANVADPDSAACIELAVASSAPDASGAELLARLATIPFGRCTWLGEGHTVARRDPVPGVGGEILTADPPEGADGPAPDLSGLSQRELPVTYLWALVIDEPAVEVAQRAG